MACEDMPEEGDDKDGSLGPPLLARAGGGGIQITAMQLGSSRVPVTMWSSDKDTKSGVGFLCVHDISVGVFFAKLQGADRALEEDGEATKGAITTLLDVAEACNSRKISLGLTPEHAGCAELICSLLPWLPGRALAEVSLGGHSLALGLRHGLARGSAIPVRSHMHWYFRVLHFSGGRALARQRGTRERLRHATIHAALWHSPH